MRNGQAGESHGKECGWPSVGALNRPEWEASGDEVDKPVEQRRVGPLEYLISFSSHRAPLPQLRDVPSDFAQE